MKQTLLTLFILLIMSTVSAQNRTLVAYYSYTGNVRAIVGQITEQIAADVVEIQPAEEGLKYEADNYAIGSALISAIRENPDKADSYPEIKPLSVDFSRYDNVIVATPLWWSQMAAPMQTFLFANANSLVGKNIALVVSSASSGISKVVDDAKRLIPNVKFTTDALWINNSNRGKSSELVAEWVGNLNFTSNMTEKLYITVGGTTLTATLVDNSSTRALVDALRKAPITYEAHDYGNFEKVGDLGQSFPTNDEPITTEPCDLILYQGHNLCIYYDVNTWDFTRLGKIDNTTQQELKAILGDGNCTVTLSLSDVKTGINDVKSSPKTDNQKYDLQGRRIGTAAVGQVYIENGQKKVNFNR